MQGSRPRRSERSSPITCRPTPLSCHPERSRIAVFRQFCAVEGPCVFFTTVDRSLMAKAEFKRRAQESKLKFLVVIPSEAELPLFGNSAQSRDLVSPLRLTDP